MAEGGRGPGEGGEPRPPTGQETSPVRWITVTEFPHPSVPAAATDALASAMALWPACIDSPVRWILRKAIRLGAFVKQRETRNHLLKGFRLSVQSYP